MDPNQELVGSLRRTTSVGSARLYYAERQAKLNVPMLISLLAFGSSIWLSNKKYTADDEKKTGHRWAAVLFFLIGPAMLYFGSGFSDLYWEGNRSGGASYCP